MGLSIPFVRSRNWRSTLKARGLKLSTFVVALFTFATLVPWVVYTSVTLAGRDERLEAATERLQLQASAYAEQIVETARAGTAKQGSEIPPPANWLHNSHDMSGVEFTTRASQSKPASTQPAAPGPTRAFRRDGKIIAEVAIPALSITAVASERESSVLAQWSRRSWFGFFLLVLRTIATVSVGAFLYRQIRWREAAQAELIRTQEAAESATRAK